MYYGSEQALDEVKERLELDGVPAGHFEDYEITRMIDNCEGNLGHAGSLLYKQWEKQ